ncbi:lytic transglycosylase [Sinorhizobium fredii USDA 205]|uniref:Transglycosylase SLT domain-containing protein n=2 Tax=Rhizobium fredii TaxID=380 RepID=A0A844AEA9_RHIFR|nr:lytic transglycosylase domain-containing protein [Sinorhizobium fredii]AWM25664.1 Soluble lytic murein transglycosylase [Sinorhizobium fredii CCBAU 25509]KSV88404.1 lytic transglycosylase [Sinorhizobium fredii USDA 205]MQX11313.1 transglycosylase SLT domain-containing protein [Sinorhizobium fredii]UTY49818.1 lytic transglycosylase domain-containing protein [Sinorhizobium fredii]GEC31620.1 lytic transglycosylase [Sinorhizobium fredii]
MAKIRISLSKQAFTAIALTSALASGCSTVERTSLEELTAVQTVTPIAKPGTEMTAYALPAPIGVASSTSAALSTQTAATAAAPTDAATAAIAAAPAGQAGITPATDATLAFAAPQTVAVPTAKPGQAFEVAMAAPVPADLSPAAASTAVEKSAESPAVPSLGVAALWESDFDTGEPVGLETLVAKRMIVPTERPRTGVIGSAVGAVASVIPDSLKLTKSPTSSKPELDRLIKHYAELNGLPLELVHRVVKRESNYNPHAYSKGNYGLMQIRYNTARGLGYDGPAEGLFDAETNLKYATRYLRGAWMVADNQHDGAVKLYASGYYYHAKRKGMLDMLDMR